MNGVKRGQIKSYLRATYGTTCQSCGCTTSKKDKRVHPQGPSSPGPTYPTIQHIIPLSQGGTWAFDNLTLFCYACNSRDNAEHARKS